MLDIAAFEQQLKSDGYLEIETKAYEPRPANGDHGHHFSVRGLILDGTFTVTVAGVPRCYRPGDIFEVAEGVIHNEAVGAEGTRLVVGRKY